MLIYIRSDLHVATDGDDDIPARYQPGDIKAAFTYSRVIQFILEGSNPISITDGSGISVTRDGTAENWIYYWAYPGETPILDCEDAYASGTGRNTALICRAVYCVHFKGLTVRNVFQRETYEEPYNQYSYGWIINDAWGSVKTNVILENCTVHDVHGSAFEANHIGLSMGGWRINHFPKL